MQNRKKLLILIEELRLDMTDDKAREYVDKFNDQEVEYMILMCEEILRYRAGMAKEALLANPEEYAKIEKDFQEKEGQLEEEHLQKLEEIQNKVDQELDKIEENSLRQMDLTLNKTELNLTKLENFKKELLDKSNSSTN